MRVGGPLQNGIARRKALALIWHSVTKINVFLSYIQKICLVFSNIYYLDKLHASKQPRRFISGQVTSGFAWTKLSCTLKKMKKRIRWRQQKIGYICKQLFYILFNWVKRWMKDYYLPFLIVEQKVHWKPARLPLLLLITGFYILCIVISRIYFSWSFFVSKE